MTTRFAAMETGGTHFVLGVGDESGTLIERIHVPTRHAQDTLADVREYFFAAMRRHGPLQSLGIAAFGPIELDRASPDFGSLLRTPKPGWDRVNLAQAMLPLGLPINVDTDVNAAALAEQAWGAARGCDHVAYITVGTGIGVGIVHDGKALHGILHPELGHILPRRMEGDDFAGVCPYHRDCFEGLAGGPAINARIGSVLSEAAPDAPIWKIEAGYIAQLCAQVVLSHMPQRIVLGGGVMTNAALLPMIRNELPRWLGGYVARRDVSRALANYIVPQGLAGESGIRGALRLAIIGSQTGN